MVSKQSAGMDVKPQVKTGYVQESAANTFTEVEIDTDLTQGTIGGKPYAIEILGVFWYLDKPDFEENQDNKVLCQLTKSHQTAMINPSNSDVIDYTEKHIRALGSRTSEANGVIYDIEPQIHNLHDGNGNGYLVGSSKIYLGIQGTGNASIKNGFVRIIYRLVEVSMTDLMGIVKES